MEKARELSVKWKDVPSFAAALFKKGRVEDVDKLLIAYIHNVGMEKAAKNTIVKKIITASLERNPCSEYIQFLPWVVTRQGNLDKADKYVTKLCEKFSENAIAHFVSGYLAASIGDTARAAVQFQRASTLEPSLASRKDHAGSKEPLPVFLPTFKNPAAWRMSREAKKVCPTGANYFQEDDNSLIYKVRIAGIEISNICNYDRIHPRCPVHGYSEKVVMPTDLVYKIIDEFGAMGYDGMLHWGFYTEPLMDSRLTEFLRYARNTVPQATNVVTTNGFCLTSTLAEDIVSAGMDVIYVSSYSLAEYIRFLCMPVRVPYFVYNSILSLRVIEDWYNRDPVRLDRVCFPFLLDLYITCRGEVALCCKDAEHKFTFGDLKKESLHQILAKPEVLHIHDELAQGRRSHPLCQRCTAGFTYPYFMLASW